MKYILLDCSAFNITRSRFYSDMDVFKMPCHKKSNNVFVTNLFVFYIFITSLLFIVSSNTAVQNKIFLNKINSYIRQRLIKLIKSDSKDRF